MAITTLDGIVAGLGASQNLSIYKASISTQAAGGMTSLWRATGNPAQGSIPGAAATATKSDTGTWNFNNPVSGYSYLASLNINGSVSHQLRIYDRLTHMGGLSGTTTTAQTIGISLPGTRGDAYTDPDLEWFCEIYSDIGTSGQTATVTYVDESDASQTFTFTLGGTSPANQDSRLFPLNSGTTNLGATKKIKSLTSVQHATTGTAGSYGFTVAKLLAAVNMGQIYTGVSYDFAGLGLPRVRDNACIWFAVVSSTTSSGIVQGNLVMVQG
jgi:hypothetical protein